MLCESCHENPATVFVTHIVNDEALQLRLCESCARQRAESNGETSIEDMVFGLFDDMDRERGANHNSLDADDLYINEVFMEIQNNDPFDEDEFDADDVEGLNNLDDEDFMTSDSYDWSDDLAAELEDAEEAPDDLFDDSIRELIKPSPFSETPERRDITARRCPKCSITWDRLRQDGRAGCAHCYEAFSDQLHDVMQRVQHAPQHHGKKPRAAEKRRSRLEHLRARRDHRLEMLNRRLEEAVRQEKYEEAAKLRDQIKMVESTIVTDG